MRREFDIPARVIQGLSTYPSDIYLCAFPAVIRFKRNFFTTLQGRHENVDEKKRQWSNLSLDEKGVIMKNDKCMSHVTV